MTLFGTGRFETQVLELFTLDEAVSNRTIDRLNIELDNRVSFTFSLAGKRCLESADRLTAEFGRSGFFKSVALANGKHRHPKQPHDLILPLSCSEALPTGTLQHRALAPRLSTQKFLIRLGIQS